MGKASKFKAIRNLAKTLPSMNRQAVKTLVSTGKELIDKGITTYPNSETSLETGVSYKHKSLISVPVDHNDNMKDAFKKGGMRSVEAYLKAVADHANKLAAADGKKLSHADY